MTSFVSTPAGFNPFDPDYQEMGSIAEAYTSVFTADVMPPRYAQDVPEMHCQEAPGSGPLERGQRGKARGPEGPR